MNQLSGETSPYLLQHAQNPVDWYPWSEQAFEKARAEDKPVFVSIGYSACHWCHVMAHESFENEQIAALLNEHFVSIKVDREERPDLDRIYMNAVQAMTGSGGWPMSVFVTPEGQPFYGGTYYPPDARSGMIGFPELLLAIANAWAQRREELVGAAQGLVDALVQQSSQTPDRGTVLQVETSERAVENLWQRFDREYGGWGGAPKFPQPMALEFLLAYHQRTGNDRALEMVTLTLDRMARGGMYDQVGGGFHRYSVDRHWAVPHFEKMLYDNAQLARVYLHAWQVTGEDLYRTVIEETLGYVLREMRDPAGGFYSTLDADSDGKEGRFYLWSIRGIQEALGDEAEAFIRAYGMTGAGTGGEFTGQNILALVGSQSDRVALSEARDRLFRLRQHRVRPGLDDKVITSWNGLQIAAFAEAARILDREDYYRAAKQGAQFVLTQLRDDDGRLLHTWREGQVKGNGFLEDYAALMDGLINLYQTDFDPAWYHVARGLADTMIAHFAADEGFYDTSDDHEALILRPRELQDNAVPSGNALAASVLLRLGGLAVEPVYAQRAQAMLASMQDLLAQYPTGFGQWLIAFERTIQTTYATAIVGDPNDRETRDLLAVHRSAYRPSHIIAAGKPEQSTVPLLQHRDQVGGHATAYVCVGTVCKPPVTEPQELSSLLKDLREA
jgi:hypothetical protein